MSAVLSRSETDARLRFIVSGLPFNNFSPAFVEQVLDALFNLLAPGGTLSYFEYMYVRPLGGSFSEPQRSGPA